MEIPPVIIELLKEGFEPILTTKDGKVVFDLQSHTKSGMYLGVWTNSRGEYPVYGRYKEEDSAEDIYDLLSIFASRFRQRDFGDPKWKELASKHGYLKKEVTTEYV